MQILAINPWIYDFAAYDFWLKPYGFLVILTYLKNKGVKINYLDCLEKKTTVDNFGRGKYYSEIVPKPPLLNSVPRYFKRYGLTPQEFLNLLPRKNPKFVLLTSSMTYWYWGIRQLVEIIRERFSTKIILGGIYPTLMYHHAKTNIPCDYIFKNQELQTFFELLNVPYNFKELYFTLPDYEYFYSHLDYVVVRTSWGCPFNCSYCAIKKLFDGFLRLPEEKIIEFISYYYSKGIKNFVLYDDAFLYPKEETKNLLKKLKALKVKVNFHTPNALHFRFLDEEIAYLLKKLGFVNIHFGLETLDRNLQKKWGDKVTTEEVIRGIKLLKRSGFKEGEFSVYLLLGYPNQNLEELKKEIDFLHSLGAKISLAEYSPVPQTPLFKLYQDKLKDPLLHNNSIFVFFENKIRDFYQIKNYVRELNKKFTT
ncbi:MAG: radical SAM protein [Candidatus Omnitrophica bacterium]|nr:radical SAM protein [Candidatus Omnitrophota bacterium]